MTIKIKQIESFLSLQPIIKKFPVTYTTIYNGPNDTNNIEDEIVLEEAFSIVPYIEKFRSLQPKIKLEIKKNYINYLTDKKKFIEYAEHYITMLDESINDSSDIDTDIIKAWFLELFQLNYQNIEDYYYLLENEMAVFYLTEEWVTHGQEPTIFPEEQQGLYDYFKKQVTIDIINFIQSFLKNITSPKDTKTASGPASPKKNELQNSTVIDKIAKKKKEKLFHEFFQDKYKNNLKFLSDIFNGPKQYAIMISLLTQNNIVVIGDGKMAEFLRAWYRYIGREIPKRSNFYSVTHYLNTPTISEPETGYKFVNGDWDPDYKSFKRLIEKWISNKE